MKDSILIRHYGMDGDGFTETMYCGVNCVVRRALKQDEGGFCPKDEMVLRIPTRHRACICCGDQIARVDSPIWFTVTEVVDNRKGSGSLSHYKVVGQR